MSRRLLLDAGNSTLKWAVVEDERWLAQGRCNYGEWDALSVHLGGITDCFVASVTARSNDALVTALLYESGLTPIPVRAMPALGDLRNGYAAPEQLGVDRWMGLVGARRRVNGPVLVVSAGTAVTIDALGADGLFFGGLIVPGVALMRASLYAGTALPEGVVGTWTPFPCTSADAIETGVVAALCGAIQRQYAALRGREGKLPACLVTGGDATILLPHLEMAVEHVPSLVLEGLDYATRGELP